MSADSDIEKEFDALARRAGLTIAADRRDALLEGYRDLRMMIARLHTPRPAASEAAFVFSPEDQQRSLRERK